MSTTGCHLGVLMQEKLDEMKEVHPEMHALLV